MTLRRRAENRGERGFTLVELLVVMALSSVVVGAVVTVTVQTMRTEQYSQQLRTVMDDGRISQERIRNELRSARRVYVDPTCPNAEPCTESSRLSIWVDRNQDHVEGLSEKVHYCLREIGTTACVDPSIGKKFELVRWTEAQGGPEESPSSAQPIARTIVGETKPFKLNVSPEETSVVTVRFVLDTQAERGPAELRMDSTIRLRNVARP